MTGSHKETNPSCQFKENILSTSIGTLYTVGYAAHDAQARIDRLMRDERTLLIDIRLSPRCGWSAIWTRQALAKRFGRRYIWEQRLGNRHYPHPERGFALAEGHAHAIQDAATLLCQGISLILLCACRDFGACHRSLVTKLIQEAVQTLRESEGH